MSWTLQYNGPGTPYSGYISFSRSGSYATTDVLQTVTMSVTFTAPYGYSGTLAVNGLTMGLNGNKTSTTQTVSVTKSANTFVGNYGYASQWQNPTGTIGFVAGGITVLSVSITVTTVTDSVGAGPTIGGNPQPKQLPQPGVVPQTPTTVYGSYFTFLAQPPSTATFATGYTTTIQIWGDQVIGRIGVSTGRFTNAAGTARLRIVSNAGTAIPFTIGATTATSHTVTFAAGQYSATITIPSTGTAGPYRVEVSTWSGTPSAAIPTKFSSQFNIGTALSNHLDFGTAPQTSAQVGDILSSFTVRAMTTASTVNTGFTGNVTLAVLDSTGREVSPLGSYVAGTTTVAAVAGIATFSTIQFSKPGTYQIKASATGYDPVTSTVITIAGNFDPDGLVGLRQNIRDDGTLWRSTTGTSGPTFATVSAANMSIIDGDMASTSSVTVEGLRFTHPHLIKLQRVDFKVSVSSIAATPTIEVYTSQDTTSPTNGTWTRQASYTPTHTNAFISAFTFATPVLTKGVWITLNKNGGAATASWRSVQICGPYLTPTLSYADQSLQVELATETTVSVPSPPAKVSGAATVERQIIMKNNTASALELSVVANPARNGGDALITSHVEINDLTGNPIGDVLALAALESKVLVFRYTCTAAENDNSGKHYVRISVFPYSAALSYLYWVKGGVNFGVSINPLADLATSSSVSTGGEDATDVLFHSDSGSHLYLSNNRATSFAVKSFSAAGSSYATHTVTAAGTATDFSRGVIMGVNAYIFNETALTVTKVPLVTTNTSTALASLTTPFSLAAQTTGAKHAVRRSGTRFWVANGTASNISIYDMDTAGFTYNTITTVTNLSGKTIQTMWWDGVNNQLSVATAVSGGSRTVARYDTTGTFIASTSNSDRSALEITGGAYAGGKVYVLYGGRYLWQYDAITMANGTELFDLGANTSSGHMMITPV